MAAGSKAGPPANDEEPREQLPPDIFGLISTSDILRELGAFPSLPHIAVFVDDSWRRWHQVPGARSRLKSSAQVCRQTHLSLPFVRDNILAFEELGEEAQFFGIRFRPGEISGCFFSERHPSVYGLQKIPTEFGYQLFLNICGELGVQPNQDPASRVPIGLLSMVAMDYGWPYGTSKPADK